MRSALAVSVVAVLLLGAACGGAPGVPSSPAAPSALAGAPASSATTVSGVISTASSVRDVSRPLGTGLTVQVVGTGLVVAVSDRGEFVLQGVPTGTVQLRITGAGVDAVVTLNGVEANQRIEVHITVSGASAVVTFDSRGNSDHARVEVNGIVSGLGGTASDFRFLVGTTAVRGDASTVFFGDGDRPDSFASLFEGARVEVKGERREGFVYAQRIHVNDEGDEDDDETVEFSGRLNSIGRTPAPDLTLTVGTTTVFTSSGTVVRRRGDVQTLAALAVGQTLEVEGTRRPDGSVDARRISIEDDEPLGQFEIEGVLGGLEGSCPSIAFGVNGYRVNTSASTTFRNGTCSELRNGHKVQVAGTRQPDGSVLASAIARK